MAKQKQFISKEKPVKETDNHNNSMELQNAAPLNDNIKNSSDTESIQRVIQSRIDVTNTNLLNISLMSKDLLKAGLIIEDECRMLMNDHNIDQEQNQNFIDLWVARKKELCRYKAAEDEIAKAQEIISILRFVDILRG